MKINTISTFLGEQKELRYGFRVYNIRRTEREFLSKLAHYMEYVGLESEIDIPDSLPGEFLYVSYYKNSRQINPDTECMHFRVEQNVLTRIH